MNLTHKRILITRPRAQAEEFATALIAEGAHPIFLPVIEIVPLNDFAVIDAALRKLDEYDWLILTSIHAVDIFFQRLHVLDMKQLPQRLRVAAIGAKTAQCLCENQVVPHFVPNEYTAEAVVSGLGEDIVGKRFLLPQSDLARELLAKEIRSAGGIVDEVVAYHTKTAQPDSATMNNLHDGIDIITFASPSSVRGFMDILAEQNPTVNGLPGNALIACIGPITAAAVREAGLEVHVEAKEHTMNGLFSALKEFIWDHKIIN